MKVLIEPMSGVVMVVMRRHDGGCSGGLVYGRGRSHGAHSYESEEERSNAHPPQRHIVVISGTWQWQCVTVESSRRRGGQRTPIFREPRPKGAEKQGGPLCAVVETRTSLPAAVALDGPRARRSPFSWLLAADIFVVYAGDNIVEQNKHKTNEHTRTTLASRNPLHLSESVMLLVLMVSSKTNYLSSGCCAALTEERPDRWKHATRSWVGDALKSEGIQTAP